MDIPLTAADDPWLRSYLSHLYDQHRSDMRRALLELIETHDNVEQIELSSSLHSLPDIAAAIAMIRRRLEQRLTELGIVRIATVGMPLDPALHLVVHTVSGCEASGTIIRELRAGYQYEGTVIRPAGVVTVDETRANIE